MCIHTTRICHINVFRLPVVYVAHVIFLGTIVKGTWESRKGSDLMPTILECSLGFGITLYNTSPFLTFAGLKAQRRI